MKETDLYGPIKVLLEGQGFAVKGEIGDADVVACREGEEPVIIELKTAFSLSLIHQAIQRLSVSDDVYVGVPAPRGRRALAAMRANRTLCRRLGIGLILVDIDSGKAWADLDPGPYNPRKAPAKKQRLLREFSRLHGDPNKGGATKRQPRMTAYRQDALRCAALLGENGPLKAANVARLANIPKARMIMADNHYGWFERVGTGIYALTPVGMDAVAASADSHRSGT